MALNLVAGASERSYAPQVTIEQISTLLERPETARL